LTHTLQQQKSIEAKTKSINETEQTLKVKEAQNVPNKTEEPKVNGKFVFVSESPKNSYQDMVTLPIEDYSNANGFDKEVESDEK